MLTLGVFPRFLETDNAFYGVSDVKFNKNYMTKFNSNICVFNVCLPENRNVSGKYVRRNRDW